VRLVATDDEAYELVMDVAAVAQVHPALGYHTAQARGMARVFTHDRGGTFVLYGRRVLFVP
jgi:hypothetical protein